MKKNLYTTIDVEGSPEQVWLALTDFTSYRQWNPFIVDADGVAARGARLRLRMQPVGARAATFKPRVSEVVEGRRLQWVGQLAVPGILRAEHTFTLEPLAGGCRLVQRETFVGLLVPLISRSLDDHTLPAFQAMNEALKELVERSVPLSAP